VRTRVGDEAAGSRASVHGPVGGGQARGARTRRGPGRYVLALSSLAGAFLFIVNRAKHKESGVPAITPPEREGHDTRGQAAAAINADDDARLSEILAAVGAPSQLGALLSDYYRDKARADRTSRELLYLHLGIAIGALRNVPGARG
jgi:hypothetical protein